MLFNVTIVRRAKREHYAQMAEGEEDSDSSTSGAPSRPPPPKKPEEDKAPLEDQLIQRLTVERIGALESEIGDIEREYARTLEKLVALHHYREQQQLQQRAQQTMQQSSTTTTTTIANAGDSAASANAGDSATATATATSTVSSSESAAAAANATEPEAGGLRRVEPMSEIEMKREWNTFCEPRARQERERRRIEVERERERELLEGKPPVAVAESADSGVGAGAQELEASARPEMATVATETASLGTQAESVKADAGVLRDADGESEKTETESAAAPSPAAVPKLSSSPTPKKEKTPVKAEAEASPPEEVPEALPASAEQLGLELSEDEQSDVNGPAAGLKRRVLDDSPITLSRTSLKRKRLHISDDEQVRRELYCISVLYFDTLLSCIDCTLLYSMYYYCLISVTYSLRFCYGTSICLL